MSTAVLRAGGPKFDVDAFLEKHSMIRPERVWHRGDKRGLGKATKRSGFNVLIPPPVRS